MKLGIITDTHDNKPAIVKAISIFNDRQVDLVVHAGDMIAPFSAALFAELKAPLKFHFGNNDGEIILLRKMLLDIGAEVYKYDFEFELGGRKILVQHEPTNLEVIAESNKYHLIIYGHTHEPDKRIVGNRTLILNPGEACGWLRGLSNIEIMDTDTMVPEIISLL